MRLAENQTFFFKPKPQFFSANHLILDCAKAGTSDVPLWLSHLWPTGLHRGLDIFWVIHIHSSSFVNPTRSIHSFIVILFLLYLLYYLCYIIYYIYAILFIILCLYLYKHPHCFILQIIHMGSLFQRPKTICRLTASFGMGRNVNWKLNHDCCSRLCLYHLLWKVFEL